jgi:lysophospholipase L1-like esterase
MPARFGARRMEAAHTRLKGGGAWSLTLALLRQQIAAQALVNTPHQAAAMASPPTVTDAGTSRPSGYTNDFLITTPANFRQLGGNPSFQASTYNRYPVATSTITGSGGNANNGKDAVAWRVTADVNSAKIGAAISATGSAAPYRFLVGGQYVNKTGLATLASNSAVNWITLDFTSVGGKAVRQITVEGMIGAAFRGFSLQSGDSLAFPAGKISAGSLNLKAVIAGDSFTAAIGATQAGDGYGLLLGEYLGIENNWLSGVGGTGFVATNSGTSFKLGDRLSDINGQSADVIMVAMGINDIGQSPATIQSNAAAVFASLRLNNPAAPIFVIGPWDTVAPSPVSADYTNTKAAIQAAMAGVSGSFFIDMEGVSFAQVGGGNIHPTTAGHKTIADYIFDQIKLAIGA